jgi:hypothetical protein
MKLKYLFIALLAFAACKSETKKEETAPISPSAAPTPKKPVLSPWDIFWTDFQQAVVRGDVGKISSYTEFPLRGSEPFNDGKRISKATFEEHFSKIFDATVVEEFKKGITNMSEYATKNQIVADQLNVPTNKRIKTTIIMSVENEGAENQTESSVTFQFVEVQPGQYKLYSLVVAG